jgi:hypothetical protein
MPISNETLEQLEFLAERSPSAFVEVTANIRRAHAEAERDEAGRIRRRREDATKSALDVLLGRGP